ncbi:MAG: MBL fold metallo-hydrolase [Rhizobiaceae bacterium]|nr:MBL fold metallo-hydrolase [Rhizobiaceae bacterium]
MRMNRRDILFSGAAMLSAGLLNLRQAQASPTSTVALGTKTINTLSDGNLVLPLSFSFPDVPQEELVAILKANDLPTDRLEPDCNITVLRDGDRLVVFDVGAGPNFMPTAGRLTDSLDAAGIDPGAVTDVVFTHAHPDHIWGLLDDFDEVIFPDANYHMGRAEWDYWRADDTLEKTPEARKSFVIGAQNRMAVLEDRIQLFNFGDEIVPGVEAVDTRGHTPGHTSFAIHDGSQSMMVLGDVVTGLVSFEKPDWPSNSDQDTNQAIATRRQIMDRMAADRMHIVGFHLPNSGIGFVERKDAAYRFVAG